MPLGRHARRLSPPIAPVFLMTAALGLGLGVLSAGCHALPIASATRVVPEAAEVPSRDGPDARPDRPARLAARSVEHGPRTGRLGDAVGLTGDASPLPPTLVRPGGTAGPRPASEPVATASQPTPLIDDAIARAEERNRVLIDEVAREDEGKPRPSGIMLPPEPAPRPSPARPAPPVDLAPPGEVGPLPGKLADPEPIQASTVAPTPTDVVPPAAGQGAAGPGPTRPEDVWREGIQRLRAVARDRQKESGRDPRPDAPNWGVRERLLGWLAEPDIDPDARSAGEVAQGRAVLKGLAALLDPGGSPSARGAEIRDAVAALEAESPLEITDLRLCKMVHGFGVVETLEPAARKAGQAVVYYCEVDGLAYEPAGPAFRSRLSMQVDLVLEGSDAPAWSKPPETIEDPCKRRRRDYYANGRFTIPESLAAGNYRVRVKIRDLVADHVATRETTLTISR